MRETELIDEYQFVHSIVDEPLIKGSYGMKRLGEGIRKDSLFLTTTYLFIKQIVYDNTARKHHYQSNQKGTIEALKKTWTASNTGGNSLNSIVSFDDSSLYVC